MLLFHTITVHELIEIVLAMTLIPTAHASVSIRIPDLWARFSQLVIGINVDVLRFEVMMLRVCLLTLQCLRERRFPVFFYLVVGKMPAIGIFKFK